jgi:ectoine hydroxylase-related dioxygenase (phytanoyl-CoA dioxygenase family)
LVKKEKMIDFKTYTGKETLTLDGFQVFDNKDIKELVEHFSTDLDFVSKDSHHSDIFRTKLGDIKQIQNLDFGILNEMLARLIGADSYVILNNQYFCKPPNYKMTSAHQDNAYFEIKKSEPVFTFWIPLQDVDVLNSCMFYVPGSHINGLVPHKVIGTNVRTRTGKTGFSLYSDVYKNSDFVKVPMKKGQILIHDKDTMHFSSPNLSDDYRVSVTCIMEVLTWK